jgi:hypothetical protein
MLNEEEKKSALDELMKDAPSSFIDIKPASAEPEEDPPDINDLLRDKWVAKSPELLDAYKYGEALAAFGDNELNTVNFFKRFSQAFINTVSNEFQKNGSGSESLKHHFDILESSLKLIAKEIETKELPEYEVSSIIASLQAFILNYTIKKDQ